MKPIMINGKKATDRIILFVKNISLKNFKFGAFFPCLRWQSSFQAQLSQHFFPAPPLFLSYLGKEDR